MVGVYGANITIKDGKGNVLGAYQAVQPNKLAGPVTVTSSPDYQWGQKGKPTRGQFDQALKEAFGQFWREGTPIIHETAPPIPLERRMKD